MKGNRPFVFFFLGTTASDEFEEAALLLEESSLGITLLAGTGVILGGQLLRGPGENSGVGEADMSSGIEIRWETGIECSALLRA